MLDYIINIVWLFIFPVIFLISIYLSMKFNFLQITHITSFFNSFKQSKSSSISPFQAFTMSLAGKIGVGSITGVFLSISLGGYGSIFWLWASSILFSILAFTEGCLAQMYKQKNKNSYTSGAYHYIKKGLNAPTLSLFYAILLFITYCFLFTSIQVKTIATSFYISFNIPFIITGIFISIIVFTIVLKGATGIATACEKLIPFMAISYICIGLIVILFNIDLLPYIFKKILNDALNVKAFGSGILTTMLIGVRRGVFSSETGVGTSAILAGSVDTPNPKSQGYIQVLSVYTTTLLICTITAFIILIANVKTEELLSVERSLNYFFGSFGSIYLSFSIFLFGISTILSTYYFGHSVLLFIFGKPRFINTFNYTLCLICIFSSIFNNSIIWNLSDLFIAILTIINCSALLLLSDKVKKII